MTFGGELAGMLSPRDDEAFFNYTDYERDALRMARLRLFGQWRVVQPVSVIAEVRTENADALEVAALYVRWRPLRSQEFDIQAGRIPSVIGSFPRRAYGRDNLVVGLPLAYQYLTSLRPDALPATADDLLRMRGRGWRPAYPIGSQAIEPGVPLVSATRWDTGVEARWRTGLVEVAGAVTRGAPAVPVVRETNDGYQWSGRVAVHVPAGLIVGVSAARATWIENDVLTLLPDTQRDDAEQALIGADLELGAGPLAGPRRDPAIDVSNPDAPVGVATQHLVRILRRPLSLASALAGRRASGAHGFRQDRRIERGPDTMGRAGHTD